MCIKRYSKKLNPKRQWVNPKRYIFRSTHALEIFGSPITTFHNPPCFLGVTLTVSFLNVSRVDDNAMIRSFTRWCRFIPRSLRGCRVRLELCFGGMPSYAWNYRLPSRTQVNIHHPQNPSRDSRFVSFVLSDTMDIGRCMCIACDPSLSRLRAVMSSRGKRE
jgi:hypothetical protein